MASRVSRWRALAQRIVQQSEALQSESEDALSAKAQSLRWRARAGTPLGKLLPETYALVRELARRELGMAHYLVQVMGGIALFEGGLAEMQTGEGKTLTALLPASLYALRGLGCHVVTVNDYLATRDAEEMSPVYKRLGLSEGVIEAESTPEERRDAYSCDITYGTSREFGFDFLRDRLQAGGETDPPRAPRVFRPNTASAMQVQRGHFFALIDEADSVLIDDAGTPLVIGVELPPSEATTGQLHWCRDVVPKLRPEEDFILTRDKRQVELTIDGCRRLMLFSKPAACNGLDADHLYRKIEAALRAELLYQRDRDYVIVDDEVLIVDESTGRTLPGRKWQDGLHQAVEAKERAPITADTGEAARITVQSFFRRYRHLAGMTGTGVTAAREFSKTYKLAVTAVPTHKRCRRVGRPPRIFTTLTAKWEAVADEVERMLSQGRAVLVGTPSVAASEGLGRILDRRGRSYSILNARYLAEEADIVAQAGHPGRITIATNMAGRGTDIKLSPEVSQAGGLHVIVTEIHSSVRIDRQIVGRCARQGDPGSFQFFLSLEDELFRAVTPEVHQAWMQQAAESGRSELPRTWLLIFRKTQRQMESRARKSRKQMLKDEHRREKLARRVGLDPYLELVN